MSALKIETTNKKVSNKLKVDTKQAKKRFNTLEDLKKAASTEDAYAIITHPARRKVGGGAKDSGKTYYVILKLIYLLETQKYASAIGFKKYSTGAANRLGSAILKVYNLLKRKGYHFPYDYEQTQQFLRRVKNRKNKKDNQSVEFLSFEGYDNMAGIDLANAGYIGLAHIEEPLLKNDPNVPTAAEWESDIATMADSCDRSVDTYNDDDPEYPAEDTEWWYTFNEWNDEHPISVELERHLPKREFYKFQLGFDIDMLEWSKPNDDINAIEYNKSIIDPMWDKIKESMIKNNTLYKYVEYDTKNGITERIDTLFFRNSKFANPVTLRNEKKLEKTFNRAYNALVTGNSSELAAVLGGQYEGVNNNNTAYNFLRLDENIDTEEYIKENNLVVDGVSIGWDIDYNRRLVYTYALYTFSKVLNEYWTPFNNRPKYIYTDPKIIVPPQGEIPAYGKGEVGENTDIFSRQIADMNIKILDHVQAKYPTVRLTFCRIDDTKGGVFKDTRNHIDRFTRLGETRRNGDWDRYARQQAVQLGGDAQEIIIDKKNTELFTVLNHIPKKPGTDLRWEIGKWEKMMDKLNSLEAAIFDFRSRFRWNMSQFKK